MKIHVGQTELWPCYYFRPAKPDSDYEQKYSIDVDEPTLERWRGASDAFHKTQNEISAALGKAVVACFELNWPNSATSPSNRLTKS